MLTNTREIVKFTLGTAAGFGAGGLTGGILRSFIPAKGVVNPITRFTAIVGVTALSAAVGTVAQKQAEETVDVTFDTIESISKALSKKS